MPYIKKEDRAELTYMDKQHPRNAGELNYLFTLLAQNYIKDHGECYQNYNDIIGALEGAKLELYRRFIGPYEDIKIEQNGDVNETH